MLLQIPHSALPLLLSLLSPRALARPHRFADIPSCTWQSAKTVSRAAGTTSPLLKRFSISDQGHEVIATPPNLPSLCLLASLISHVFASRPLCMMVNWGCSLLKLRMRLRMKTNSHGPPLSALHHYTTFLETDSIITFNRIGHSFATDNAMASWMPRTSAEFLSPSH